MKLNQKVRYAVQCLFELSKYIGEYIDANLIAKNQAIPTAYAQKILQSLAHAGLVLAHKGVGYKLVRPLEEITALELMEALNKEVEVHPTPSNMGFHFEQRINKALESFTLGELMVPR